jgi:hypothetical protein
MEIQDEINRAIASGSAKFEVSEQTEKLSLSVEEGSKLIAILDQQFGSAKLSLKSSAIIRDSDAFFSIKVGDYLIVPSPSQHSKRVKDGYHIYLFNVV